MDTETKKMNFEFFKIINNLNFNCHMCLVVIILYGTGMELFGLMETLLILLDFEKFWLYYSRGMDNTLIHCQWANKATQAFIYKLIYVKYHHESLMHLEWCNVIN